MPPEKKLPRGSFLPEMAQRRMRLPRDRSASPPQDRMGDALRARGIPVDDAAQKQSFLAGLLHPRR